MHGAELPHQVIELFPSYPPVGRRNGQHVLQFLEFALWEGDCLNDPPEDLLEGNGGLQAF